LVDPHTTVRSIGRNGTRRGAGAVPRIGVVSGSRLYVVDEAEGIETNKAREK